MIALNQYITGGRATFTLVSRQTGARFTFKVTKKKDSEVCFVRAREAQNYNFLGVIFCGGNTYSHGRKSNISKESTVAKAFDWFWRNLNSEKVEFHPSGTCCCCGRKLTTPESIAAGVGPECAKRFA